MFNEILKELRENANLSQSQLAEKISYSQSHIAKWEKNIHEPTANALIALAKVFNVSIDYLIGRTDNPEVSELFLPTAPSSEEKEVLHYFNQLSKTNKIVLRGYIRGLAEGQNDVSNKTNRGD